MATQDSISLVEFNRRLSSLVAAAPAVHDVWVTAETSDLRVSGGHCYMELLQKDAAGATVAKLRAMIWASNLRILSVRFAHATGGQLASGLKVMVRMSASIHPVYGLSAVISDINPEYTLGDLVRRRQEILNRLHAEGVLEMNRQLPLPVPCLRVAVVSARGAAGYGDFMDQLANNGRQLAFRVELFEAVLQGDRAPQSIISALERIAVREDEFDCVVIIRGGGATTDLATLDDYALAANVAQFPLPVIVGVGHERDVTVLDYVGFMRVKTPTAAAEWLIAQAVALLDRLAALAGEIYRTCTERLQGCHRRLDYLHGQIAPLAQRAIDRERSRLGAAVREIPMLVQHKLERQQRRLETAAALLDALSPEATLRRGYTITRRNGYAVTAADQLTAGDVVTTQFADGSLISKIL